jgi:ATP-binding cassette subfamily B protein
MSSPEFSQENASHDLAANHVSAGRILALFKPYKRQIARVVTLLLFGSAVGMASPFLLRAIIDQALPQGDIKLLMYLAGGLIGVAALSAGLNTLQIVMSTKIGQSIMHDLRVWF